MVSVDCFFFLPVVLKDVMMLGAVGAYAWSGTVVHQKGSKVDIFPFSAFEGALQDRNHSSLLGGHLHDLFTLLYVFILCYFAITVA